MASLVAYGVTGKVSYALTIGGAEILWETPLFFTHETIWRSLARKLHESKGEARE
jgi:uncharacterized membrane protein